MTFPWHAWVWLVWSCAGLVPVVATARSSVQQSISEIRIFADIFYFWLLESFAPLPQGWLSLGCDPFRAEHSTVSETLPIDQRQDAVLITIYDSPKKASLLGTILILGCKEKTLGCRFILRQLSRIVVSGSWLATYRIGGPVNSTNSEFHLVKHVWSML